MHLKKPCKICNMANTELASSILHAVPSQHNAHLRNMKSRYELWLYLPDINVSEILVYLKSDTIEVFQKTISSPEHDLLLLLFPIPVNVKTAEIIVKEINGGIKIMMPKIERTIVTTPILLPIET